MLTRAHLQLVVDEVKHQQDESPETFAGFAMAYTVAYFETIYISDEWTYAHLANSITHWQGLIKPNLYPGYRRHEVLVNGNMVCPAQDVPQRMERFIEMYLDKVYPDADTAYQRFEEIHPFADGNGRVGMILWCVYTYWLTAKWPLNLPPDLWSK